MGRVLRPLARLELVDECREDDDQRDHEREQQRDCGHAAVERAAEDDEPLEVLTHLKDAHDPREAHHAQQRERLHRHRDPGRRQDEVEVVGQDGDEVDDVHRRKDEADERHRGGAREDAQHVLHGEHHDADRLERVQHLSRHAGVAQLAIAALVGDIVRRGAVREPAAPRCYLRAYDEVDDRERDDEHDEHRDVFGWPRRIRVVHQRPHLPS
mmetsp:Transcript_30467/g.72336  ORF Transcript_30467/g.72336 Transcript_30467/m.72336 type:complete len:212 (+) Transcript_30467:648-1283(+)